MDRVELVGRVGEWRVDISSEPRVTAFELVFPRGQEAEEVEILVLGSLAPPLKTGAEVSVVGCLSQIPPRGAHTRSRLVVVAEKLSVGETA